MSQHHFTGVPNSTFTPPNLFKELGTVSGSFDTLVVQELVLVLVFTCSNHNNVLMQFKCKQGKLCRKRIVLAK